MNYRHAFHAGNFADVFKHTILVDLIESLKVKQTPFCYVETHAGSGRYDLRGPAASKTREYEDGVVRLLGATTMPATLHIYLNLVRALNSTGIGNDLTSYPGSPMIASSLMRDDDRALLCEIQPDEARRLKQLYATDARIGVHERDGYAALGALLPPRERRGLVLIDPPYEAQGEEFRKIEAAMASAYSRWPTGIYAIWYPIKLREPTVALQRWFGREKIAKVLCVELLLHPDNSALRLNGCGMIIVNPPWKFERKLAELLPVLRRHLSQGRFSQERIEWLTPS
ncbi:MAG TPA: 23S rRNA (adenine(2030)-N(6))-methyltransferase RlmJ [Rudaea sp.]|nr:23S rRNA (adenine(2030)-N(6))-methyltransferase RlmJ [Rudaea sp.]